MPIMPKGGSLLHADSHEAIARKVIGGIENFLEHDTNKTEDDELLTPDEIAAYLKTSVDQIYQWVSQSRHGLSDFPYLKSGRLLRFSKNEIMQWLKSNGKH